MSELELIALDGSSPLAFLASLGTLRGLSDVWKERDVRMSWRQAAAWTPVLHADGPLSAEAVVEALDLALKPERHKGIFSLGKDLNIPASEFRGFAEQAAMAAVPGDRLRTDFIAAFASDGCTDDKGAIQDTALRTMSGAGHQHFLAFMRELTDKTKPEHLEKALFQPWAYKDLGPSMRWDPVDDRRYALRWSDPSGDKTQTVRGANRLAVEGLSMLPTAPTGRTLATTGFRGRRATDTAWTWPIWSPSLDPAAVRSLLALRELQQDVPSRQSLAAMGIQEVFRARRITQGKYRNFTPAQAV